MTKRTRLPLLLGALGLVGCSLKPSLEVKSGANENAIIGGEEVATNDPIVQSTVGLYAEQAGPNGKVQSFICTGTLVSVDLVVTAAHCLGNETAQMLVIFGTKMEKGAPMLPVVAQAGHPRYSRIESNLSRPPNKRDISVLKELQTFGRGDIALLRFAGKVPAGFKPAAIANTLNILKDGSVVTLAGFGRTVVSNDPKVDDGSGTLRRVDLPIAAVEFNRGEILIDRVKGKSACMGDSGGPALAQRRDGRYIVFGVTSAGLGEGANTCTAFVAYTSIPAYFPWLEKAAAALDKINPRDALKGDRVVPINVEVPDSLALADNDAA